MADPDPRPGGDHDSADGPGDPAVTSMRERWFACSCALGWSVPAEWPDPTVDVVCAAVTARPRSVRAVERALARWAGARAAAGVGLAETLSDLAALHTAVAARPAARAEDGPDGRPDGRLEVRSRDDVGDRERSTDGVRLLRTVSLAWTDVACGDLAETAAVDPLSGLASVRYLRTRLAELYRGARARGATVGDEEALVAVRLDVHGWARVGPLTVAGNAASVVFDAGESLAVVGRQTVVVLAPRAGLAERTRVLRRLLRRRLGGAGGVDALGVRGSPTVRIVPLPATHEGACALLERLRGDDRTTRADDDVTPSEAEAAEQIDPGLMAGTRR